MLRPVEQFYRGFGARLTPYSRVFGVLRSKPTGRLRQRAARLLHRMGDFIG